MRGYSVVAVYFREAIDWLSSTPASEVVAAREQMVTALEKANAQMWETGRRESWFGSADGAVRAVCGDTNGELLEQLLRAGTFCP